MGLFSGISKALSRVDDAVVRPVTRVVSPITNIPAVRNTVDGIGDRLFGDQGSGNRTKAVVAAGAVAGGLAAAGAFTAAAPVAPGLAAATGQTAAQVAAVSSTAVSSAVPAGLAAATTGSGIAASSGLSSIMGGLSSVASGVKEAATTAALVKTLAGGAASPRIDPLPSSFGLPSVDFSGPAMQLDPPMNWGSANPDGLIRSASYPGDRQGAGGVSPLLILAGVGLVVFSLMVKR